MKVTECYIEVVLHEALKESVSIRKGVDGFYWYTTKDYNPFEHGAEPCKTINQCMKKIASHEKECLIEIKMWDFERNEPKK